MKTLTGTQAVNRLVQRGGQVEVWSRALGTNVRFKRVRRASGANVILALRRDQPAPSEGGRPFATDAERSAIAREMELARDAANEKIMTAEQRFELVHRDWSDDGGIAQIGCVFIAPSLVVGLVIGLIASLLLIGRIAPNAWWVAPIAGLVITWALVGPVMEICYRVEALRDHVEDVAFGWQAIVPGLATAAIAIAMGALKVG